MAVHPFVDFQNALLSDNVETVKYLLVANPDWVDEDVYTPEGPVCPLYLAIKECFTSKNMAMVNLLFECGADLKKCNQQYLSKMQTTPLVQAAKFGHPLLEILLERDVVDDNIESRLSFTALHHAARRGDLELVQKLIDKGFDVNWLCDDLNTAVHAAAFSGHLEVLKVLLKNGAELTPNNSKTSPLHLAVRYNHIEMVKLLLDHGSDVNEGNSSRFSPLMMACSCDLEDIVQVLLERGADVNNQRTVSSPFHFSPLSIAAFHGKSNIVGLLLKYGAEVNNGNECSITPLHIATNAVETEDSIQTVKVMLKNGANMNNLDSLGRSPLIYSLTKGREKITYILIKCGSSLEPHENFDPLLSALTTPNISKEIMELILLAGYDTTEHGDWLELNELQQRMALWEIELDGCELEERRRKMSFLMNYLTTPCQLQEVCRIKIRRELMKCQNGIDILPAINKLPITKPVLSFLRFET